MIIRMGLVGKKVGMTHIFNADGHCVPVTILELGPNTVVQKKTKNTKDGYGAIQLGFGEKDHKKVNKPLAGHFKAAKVKPQWVVREIRLADEAKLGEFEVGQELKADIFQEGEFVDVTGTSKGKGFQGVMKRHNMKGSKQSTHGTHEFFRHQGSIGCRTTPGRVMPGKRMAGHMGDETVTTQNLKIVKIDLEQNLVLIEGAVPGAKNGYVMVRQAMKKLQRAAGKKAKK